MAGSKYVWGIVDGTDGTPLSGQGFRSEPTRRGTYIVFFDKPYNSLPAVVATVVDADGGTRNNAVVSSISADRFLIRTGNDRGSRRDRTFSFIAVGD